MARQFPLVKQFKGPIMVVDKMLKPCIDAGIIPDYVFTIENISVFGYFFQDIKRGVAEKITAIISKRTHANTIRTIQARGFKLNQFDWEFLDYTSNVGLMAFVYCWMKLKIKQICLIGFDHCDTEDKEGIPCFAVHSSPFDLFYIYFMNPYTRTVCFLDPIHQLWYEQFFDFLQLAPNNLKVYNCTGEGALFGDVIEWSHLSLHLEG